MSLRGNIKSLEISSIFIETTLCEISRHGPTTRINTDAAAKIAVICGIKSETVTIGTCNGLTQNMKEGLMDYHITCSNGIEFDFPDHFFFSAKHFYNIAAIIRLAQVITLFKIGVHGSINNCSEVFM